MKLIAKFREKLDAKLGHGLHKMETGFHATYLGAAFMEGHGLYAAAALGLLVVVVLLMIAGEH